MHGHWAGQARTQDFLKGGGGFEMENLVNQNELSLQVHPSWQRGVWSPLKDPRSWTVTSYVWCILNIPLSSFFPLISNRSLFWVSVPVMSYSIVLSNSWLDSSSTNHFDDVMMASWWNGCYFFPLISTLKLFPYIVVLHVVIRSVYIYKTNTIRRKWHAAHGIFLTVGTTQ